MNEIIKNIILSRIWSALIASFEEYIWNIVDDSMQDSPNQKMVNDTRFLVNDTISHSIQNSITEHVCNFIKENNYEWKD